jgi:hypothetical protein
LLSTFRARRWRAAAVAATGPREQAAAIRASGRTGWWPRKGRRRPAGAGLRAAAPAAGPRAANGDSAVAMANSTGGGDLHMSMNVGKAVVSSVWKEAAPKGTELARSCHGRSRACLAASPSPCHGGGSRFVRRSRRSPWLAVR